MRAPPPLRRALPTLFVLGAVAAAFVTVIPAGGVPRPGPSPAGDWRGLVGEPRANVALGERMIVLLKTPSVAQRLAHAHYATESQERAWWASAYASQKQVLLKLAGLGVTVEPDYSYREVLDGFSAVLDPRAVALLDQMPEVAGIYPVRTTYPSSFSARLVGSHAFDAASGHRPDAGLPGYDGRGVTIALLDTGVDLGHPYLRGRVRAGIDLVGRHDDASARADPQDPTRIERHGTELAGILVGSHGPQGLRGVAPAATVLPIRVAGWQTGADGRDAVFGRSDQLLAGLDRAVDPNGDGDAHDAVRVALVGVSEPYAAFADGPEAQAVQGALELNMLVVAPAGNDGAAGPVFGSVAGPAGAPGALAVAATDSRTNLPKVRVVLRRGLDVILDRKLPLIGAAAPTHSLVLRVGAPRGTRGDAGTAAADFFTPTGLSRVAGEAAVLRAAADPAAQVAAAAAAGAAAVVLYGSPLPAGGLRLTEHQTVPVVSVPTSAAAELLAAARAGLDVGIAIGAAGDGANRSLGRVAGFSSRGVAYDSGLKPNLAAPGVGILTAEPGAAADGTALYGTVNGTSASAATVAGAAALLAQMRPSLDGPALQSLLTGYASGRPASTAAGGGVLRLGASAVGEVATEPSTLGFGLWGGSHWHATRTVVVRNTSSRPLQVSLTAAANGDSDLLHLTVQPDHFVLGIRRARKVKVTVRAPKAAAARLVTGSVNVAVSGSETLHVPWALVFHRSDVTLLPRVSLSSASFTASDTSPAILNVQAGNLISDHGLQVQPVRRLDVLLYDASGAYLGVMARLRDLLPGSYSFGITGRGPTSTLLPKGVYELRLAAWPTLPATAKPSRQKVRFTLR